MQFVPLYGLDAVLYNFLPSLLLICYGSDAFLNFKNMYTFVTYPYMVGLHVAYFSVHPHIVGMLMKIYVC